ncbi:DNA sulfur modification protein DndD [Nostoc sp. 'Lobaria pulmonaria (5183) cyanobiont']|uniref:DNA sulfur modification protein DndD n=1 Tax=Nostoc sp. 'Lobaria pulmonaria (5183) cyanobiont' TaxID=1618022 RepID=UPI000CF31331|nr:DNA sulfur modification protein DndD [Nostoc sp. 'Lobaria pulmonaria (5183) cyanobiont']AVH70539.1 DNA sulfur modification protein DndD [Nostoc sp. 'Lobaria pulmonaria (5183) cyanobiont']
MIFLELVLQNFGPYSGKQVINLNPKVDEENSRPIILLGGMNGGGKTTLMDAIRLALYGPRAQCSTRGNLSYNDFLNQCVNNKAESAVFSQGETLKAMGSPQEEQLSKRIDPVADTRIELLFEHIENDKPIKYRVVRSWTKNPKDGKDTLGILGDSDTWPDALVNIWDEYIENLLPLGISNLFLFDGEQVKELAEQETPPPLVVDAIRGLLGLELADRLAVDLDILVNRKLKEVGNTKDLANLEEIETRLTQQQEDYQTTGEKLETLKNQVEELEQKQQEAFNKFISEGGKIAAERNQLELQQDTKTAEIEQVRQLMCELAADVLPLALIPNLLNQAQAQGEKEFRHQQVQISKDLLLERDQRLLAWLIQAEISPIQVEKIQSFLIQDVDSLYTKTIQIEASWLLADDETLSQLDNLIYHLQNSKLSAKEKLAILKNKEEEIHTLERQVQTAAAPEDYTKLRQALETAQNQVVEAKANYETIRRRLAELETIIAKSKKELSDYTVENIKHKNSEHIITSAAKVQNTLKIFREKLTLRKLNKLEEEVKNCFLYLLHKSDLVHRITIDTKTFSLLLYDLNGKPVPKHRLSAGEKQLLAIAFLWGLAKVSGHRLPVAIDTPLGRLDSSHRSNLVERYFPSASHQVILLSTDTEIGKKEVETLRENEAIAREYLLKYDSATRQTTIQPGYFW